MKNLQQVGGISLVGRAIKTCLLTAGIESVVVTTDDDLIASEAEHHGATVVDRPPGISTGGSRSEEALLHAIRVAKIESEIIAFVECTSPFISPKDLQTAIDLVSAGDFDTAFSIAHSDQLLWGGNPKALEPILHNPRVQTMRQERGGLFTETGAFYCFRRELFMKEKNRFSGRVGGVTVARGTDLEVDYVEDLVKARALFFFFEAQNGEHD